ncbi:MAG: hypothetical protein U0324_36490 [Polyangiales bacterium]
MVRSTLLLSLLSLACIGVADAQPRRPSRRRPAPARPAPTAPAPTPASLDVRHVVERRSGDWEARCVAVRGCPAPRPLARCPQPGPRVRLMERRALADVIAQRSTLVGQRVSVRGPLRAFLGCSELACPRDVCCNACFSNLMLGAEADARASITLGADRDPVLGCRGDDSGLCCGTEVPTGEVVATGTLRADPGGSLRLVGADLCAP